jgi:MFS family permease
MPDTRKVSAETASRPNWQALWQSGALPRFCFISLGIAFHAGAENMMSTIMPAMVRDIGGVQLNGWIFAIYEIGSIIAGAAAGRLATYWTVRANMIAAALIFAIGCTATALSPTMYWALGGRIMSGFGGGALIALSFVAIQRHFPSAIWPQLMAIMSVVWGIAAFSAPLYGGVMGTLFSWRWAILSFGAAAVAFAAACTFVLRDETVHPSTEHPPGRFPALALLCLALGVTAVAAAGVETRIAVATALAMAGLAGVAFFFWLDSRNKTSRLFPTATFDPRGIVGSGMIMVGSLALATCSFGFYGPLLLAALHDFSPVTTGLIIASESVSWSILSILVAGAAKRWEPLIVRLGALMIAGGVAGFAWAVPSGSIAVILFFALLQGGGFGILWPFAARRVVEAALPQDREIAAAAFSTLQRIGYAVGAAIAGIIANANGFSGGFTRHGAASAAVPLFVYFIPLAALGVWAAFRLTRPARA